MNNFFFLRQILYFINLLRDCPETFNLTNIHILHMQIVNNIFLVPITTFIFQSSLTDTVKKKFSPSIKNLLKMIFRFFILIYIRFLSISLLC